MENDKYETINIQFQNFILNYFKKIFDTNYYYYNLNNENNNSINKQAENLCKEEDDDDEMFSEIKFNEENYFEESQTVVDYDYLINEYHWLIQNRKLELHEDNTLENVDIKKIYPYPIFMHMTFEIYTISNKIDNENVSLNKSQHEYDSNFLFSSSPSSPFPLMEELTPEIKTEKSFSITSLQYIFNNLEIINILNKQEDTKQNKKAVIKLICTTLSIPESQLLQQILAYDSSYKEKSSFQGKTSKSLPIHLLTVNYIRNIFEFCGKNIRCLFSDQILDSLRNVRPITNFTLDIIMHHLNNLKQSKSLQVVTIPLLFLDIREGRKLFPNELGTNHTINLEKCNDIYYYIEKKIDSDSYRIPYWLILLYKQYNSETLSSINPSSDFLKIYFHSNDKKINKTKIFNDVKEMIFNVCKRVNQLILLYQLFETRICSSSLVPDHLSSNLNEQEISKISTKSLFSFPKNIPGQFSCPCVYTISLPILNNRIQISKAISFLIDSAFHPFIVTNKTNLFVFRENTGHIFYMKISSLKKNFEQTSPEKQPLELTQIQQQPQQYIVIEIFGLYHPSSEITEQFYQLLESRLSFFTSQVLSTLLYRNPLLKLTLEDVLFLRGSNLPVKNILYSIPASLFYSNEFLNKIKQFSLV